VTSRDASADGTFVYGVRSTGVYCRPSCGARRPRVDRVIFYATSAEAEAAGFRPCLRCRPTSLGLVAERAAMIAKACRRLENDTDPPKLAVLAAEAGLSPAHFHRLFKVATGVTPKDYAMGCRAARLTKALRRAATVTAAAYEAGFNASSRFYAEAVPRLGMTPRAYRAGGEGMVIRFGVGTCSLGAVLVAATQKGICAVSLGDEAEPLVQDLQDLFPAAELIGGDQTFEQWMAAVVGFVEIPRVGLDLPLDIRGTAFQQRVWQALREIPLGETATYGQIAAALGLPKAHRAVAAACAANKIGVLIPCHRVVRTDGGLSGYRWGVARKRDLLSRERNDDI
jgi:AraC family transcriptional regulator of adaptative response/methylated-DNA-[protein]-cysteine methyltransferase